MKHTNYLSTVLEKRNELLKLSDCNTDKHNSSESGIFLQLFCCINTKCNYLIQKISVVRGCQRVEKYFSGCGNMFWLDTVWITEDTTLSSLDKNG